MMTRNLGALNNDIGNATAASYLRNSGMHYQWGRKDPFIPLRNNQQFSSTTNKGDGVVSWGIARIGTEVLATDFDGRNGSLVYANSHPNKLINSTSNSAPNDWFTNSASISICNYLWGGGYYYRLVDGKVSNEVHEVAATKSLFDPCPLGYRMPVVGVWGFDRYYGQTGQSVDIGKRHCRRESKPLVLQYLGPQFLLFAHRCLDQPSRRHLCAERRDFDLLPRNRSDTRLWTVHLAECRKRVPLLVRYGSRSAKRGQQCR